jgi:diketogulonate reductase-like aldo/keto reductase
MSRAIIVTTSSKKERLEGYLDVGDIELTDKDVEAIDKAGAEAQLTGLVKRFAPKMGWALLGYATYRLAIHVLA